MFANLLQTNDAPGPQITCIVDCAYGEYEWVFQNAAPLLILVIGGLMARRWRELPLVALASLALIMIVGYLRYRVALSRAPTLTTPFVTLEEVGPILASFTILLLIATIAHVVKRAIKFLFAPRPAPLT